MCRDQSGLVVAQGGIREVWGETAQGYQVSFGDDESVLELDSVTPAQSMIIQTPPTCSSYE